MGSFDVRVEQGTSLTANNQLRLGAGVAGAIARRDPSVWSRNKLPCLTRASEARLLTSGIQQQERLDPNMTSEPTERERLHALHAWHVQAWSDRDLEALSKVFDPDCLVFHGPSPVLNGWEAYRKRLEERLAAFDEFSVRSYDGVARVDERLEDRIAWIAARYEIVGVKGGRDYSENGRWTGIYEKQNDTWCVVHLHISPDPGPE